MDEIQLDISDTDKQFEFELNIDNSADFDMENKEDHLSFPGMSNSENNIEHETKSGDQKTSETLKKEEEFEDQILLPDAGHHTESVNISIIEENVDGESNLCDILSQIQQEKAESGRGDNSQLRTSQHHDKTHLPEEETKNLATVTTENGNNGEFFMNVDPNDTQNQDADKIPHTMIIESVPDEETSAGGEQSQADNFVEGEQSISLEDILNRRKKDEDLSSDSEFDFEMPNNKPTPDQTAQKINSATASEVSNKNQISTNQTSGPPSHFQSSASPAVALDSKSSLEQNVPEQDIVQDHVDKESRSAMKAQGNEAMSGTPQQLPASSVTDKEAEHADELQREPVPLALTRAQDEWENVQTIEAGYGSTSGTKKGGPSSTPMLSFYELDEYFRGCDFSDVKSKIRTGVDRHGFSALKHLLFGPPRLNRNLTAEKERIFCIAASNLDNSNENHMRALQTVYRCLTGSRFDCSRFGSHWEEIGFQGNDPATDLRGGGLLGLLNLINFLRTPKQLTLASDIYKLSLHPTQNFPFCVMGINLSRISLQALREDCLNKECNKRQEVMGVVNDLYAALFLSLYQTWKSQGKTVTDSGFVLKDIETIAKRNPQKLLKNLDEYLVKKKGNTSGTVNLENMDIGGENFLSVCDSDAGQY